MKITLKTEEEISCLRKVLPENFNMFEMKFKMEKTGEMTIAHSHFVFPKCRNLSFFQKNKIENFIVSYPIDFNHFEKFLDLLYGGSIEVSFNELMILNSFADYIKYSGIEKIKSAIIDNVHNLEFSDENNQMPILIELLQNSSFSREVLLNNCKLSQLKRLKFIINDVNLLKAIIDTILCRYAEDTKNLMVNLLTKYLIITT